MKRRVGLREVAERAGVSHAAVSYVMNGREDFSVSEPTRQRILDAAAALGYRPNGIARSLVLGKTQTIGVLVPSVDDAFTAGIVNGIQDAADGHDYRVLLAHSRGNPDTEAKQARLLLDYRVDGLICVVNAATAAKTEAWLSEAASQGVACVIVDDRIPGLPVDCVTTDDHGGAMAVVRHLVELGHRRIGYVSAGVGTSNARARWEGYRAGLTEAGIPIDDALIVGDSFSATLSVQSMNQLLDLPEPPTAVFAANDHMAAKGLQAAVKRGVRVPEDLALVGFGDLSTYWYLHLTSVLQPCGRMGEQTAERLFRRLEQPDLPPEELVIPTRLVVRKSCGSPEA